MKRWMVKAMKIINQVMEEKGPQTHSYLHDLLIEKALSERKYHEIMEWMTSKSLMQLLKINYYRVGYESGRRTSYPVILWGLEKHCCQDVV